MLLEPVQDFLRIKAINAREVIAKDDCQERSQFFHNLRHFPNQEKDRSTTQRLRDNLKFVQFTTLGHLNTRSNQFFYTLGKRLTGITVIN